MSSCTNGEISRDSFDQVEASTVIDLPIKKVRGTTILSESFRKKYDLQGKIKAHQKVTLYSKLPSKIIDFKLREGQNVLRGDTIVRFENNEHLQFIVEMKAKLNETIVNRDERRMMVSGLTFGVDSTLTDMQNNYINTISGYNTAKVALDKAEYQLNDYYIKAPFSGVLADVKIQIFQQIQANHQIATLINPFTFEVEFLVLEEVALKLNKGMKVKVRPFQSQDAWQNAIIVSINPFVSVDGLVRVNAKLNAGHELFLEGMNVDVTIERTIPNQIVLPKQAVLTRSGKSVVFTYDTTSKLAKWNYVQLSDENGDNVIISEGIKVGDIAIIEGNLNLSHNSRIMLVDDYE